MIFIRSVIHRQGTLESQDMTFLPATFQNGPELLPRRDMLILLTRVIGTGSPRLQVSPRLHNHSQDSAKFHQDLTEGNAPTWFKFLRLVLDASFLLCFGILLGIKCLYLFSCGFLLHKTYSSVFHG